MTTTLNEFLSTIFGRDIDPERTQREARRYGTSDTDAVMDTPTPLPIQPHEPEDHQ